MQEPAYNLGISSHRAPQGHPTIQRTRLYTPSQVCLGSLLGGPVGMVCYLRANYVALGRQAAANRMLAWGLAAFIPMLIVVVQSSSGLPWLVLTLAYAVLAGQAARVFQMPQQAIDRSTHHCRQSNWRVVGIGMLCSLLSLALAFALAMALQRLGMPIS